MKQSVWRLFLCSVAVAATCAMTPTTQAATVSLGSSWSTNAGAADRSTLSGESSSGYTYLGSGTAGLPGSGSARPKTYQTFGAVNLSDIGDTLEMEFDLTFLSTSGGLPEAIQNNSQDLRFGFVSTGGNSGEGVTMGLNLDIGSLAGSTYYEFFLDPDLETPADFNSAFSASASARLNAVGNGGGPPSSANVAFDSMGKSQHILYRMTKTADGYDLRMEWTDPTSTDVIINTTSATTLPAGDAEEILVAGATSWDGLGFFINDADNSGFTWSYELSNMTITTSVVPEPTSMGLAMLGLAGLLGARRQRAAKQ